MLYLSSQLLKVQDLNIVSLCSLEFSHYARSTGPTKKLDLDIMHKLQDGEQVTHSDVTKFAHVHFHNVSDQQVFKVSSSHTIGLFQYLRVS